MNNHKENWLLQNNSYYIVLPEGVEIPPEVNSFTYKVKGGLLGCCEEEFENIKHQSLRFVIDYEKRTMSALMKTKDGLYYWVRQHCPKEEHGKNEYEVTVSVEITQ